MLDFFSVNDNNERCYHAGHDMNREWLYFYNLQGLRAVQRLSTNVFMTNAIFLYHVSKRCSARAPGWHQRILIIARWPRYYVLPYFYE
jgi:hypothetical protein